MRSLYRKLIVPLVAVSAVSGFGPVRGCDNNEKFSIESEEIRQELINQELLEKVTAYNDSLEVSRGRADSLQKIIDGLLKGRGEIYGSRPITLSSGTAGSSSETVGVRDSTATDVGKKDYAEAKPVEVKSEGKPTWRYNDSYNFFDDSKSPDGRVDAFNVDRGNTIAGGILELAKKEGKKLTPKQAYDLSDNVSVWRKGKEVKVDPARLQIGDVVDFRGAVQDAIYGPKLEQRVAETPVVSLPAFDQLTSADLDENGEINYNDVNLFLKRYSEDPQAMAVNPCGDSDTPNRANAWDFYPLISAFGEEDKITTTHDDFVRLAFEKYKAGEFDCGEDKPESDGVKRNLVLVGLNDLALRGASTAASYDRFLNYGFGVGVQTGAFDSNLMVLGRLSYGGDNYRVGIGVGPIYTDDKTAIAMEPFLQFRLPQSRDAYGELGAGVSDFGRWKDHIEGDGFDGTKKYGFVGLKVGKRF